MIEEWRKIPSFPAYEASSFGGIRSRFRVLKQQLTDKGYRRVNVYRGGKAFAKEVHWLVCEAFHGPKPAWAADAAHNNGKKLINRAENLRWATKLSNAADAKRHGTLVHGERHSRSVFTQSQVKTIRAQYRVAPAPETIARLADAFSVTEQTIRNIVAGRSWAASFVHAEGP